MTNFNLETTGRITPSEGEDLGRNLWNAADLLIAQDQVNGHAKLYVGNSVAAIYDLAAQAFQKGANASIGHNRTERYEDAARKCKAEAKRHRAAWADYLTAKETT